jgi:NAD(P)-dependent dehydrogenase (short-subunit alcohol dehydrogenase family)
MNPSGAKSVLITGASSGIGRATALLLAGRGFRVFAAVRKPSDGSALEAEGGGSVSSILLDVTDRALIARAAGAVREQLGGGGLDALVNNAGIAQPAPLEYVSEEALRHQFEVNVFGQIAVTQAFLPLIRGVRGRIVNIGSVGSHIALPFGGALCASKAAFSSLSDSLRLELWPSGIHVCLVEPGAIRTPAVDKTLGDPEALIGSLPPEGAARYGAALREFMRRGHARESKGSPPQIVAEAVYHALTARRPRLRYVVGADARSLVALPRLLPERLLDRVRLRMLGLRTEFGSDAPGAASAPAH